MFFFCLHFSKRQQQVQQQRKNKRDLRYHHLPEFYNAKVYSTLTQLVATQCMTKIMVDVTYINNDDIEKLTTATM